MVARPEKAAVPFNPAVLRWARERRRLAPEDAARHASVSAERLSEWEAGTAKPSVGQGRRLAAFYDRPFLEFLSPTLPEVATPQLVPDFRFHRVPPSSLEVTSLESVQIWAEEQRLNALTLYDELGETAPRFPPEMRASVADDPDKIAAKVRRLFRFSIDAQLNLKSVERYKFPSMLRSVFESVGVIILKQSGLSKARARGLCLYDETLPIIVFGNESPGAQAFTLVHEFAHIVLGCSALSGPPRIGHRYGLAGKQIEAWCNSFAAAFLMPADAVRSHRLAPKTYVQTMPDSLIGALASAFCVSRQAMLIRFVSLGLVDPWYYWRVKRPQFIKEEGEFESGGRPEYYGSRFRNTLGDLYTGLVVEALETGKIGFQSAAEFMGTRRVSHLLDIRDHFVR